MKFSSELGNLFGYNLQVGEIVTRLHHIKSTNSDFMCRYIYAARTADKDEPACIYDAGYIEAIKIVGHDEEVKVGPSWYYSNGLGCIMHGLYLDGGKYRGLRSAGSHMTTFISALIHLIRLTDASMNDLLMVKWTIRNTYKNAGNISTWGIVQRMEVDTATKDNDIILFTAPVEVNI